MLGRYVKEADKDIIKHLRSSGPADRQLQLHSQLPLLLALRHASHSEGRPPQPCVILQHLHQACNISKPRIGSSWSEPQVVLADPSL